jgi:type II secretory pathway pseudopilin PulG
MRQGFSLLEVVLAIGILGFSLPMLLTHMAESTSHTEKRMQEILVANIGKSVQNVLSVINKAPELDSNNWAYCGYKDGIFTIKNTSTGFDGAVFVLGQETVQTKVKGSIKETVYGLYPWDSSNQSPRLTMPHATITQSVVMMSLAIAWLNEVVLGKILAMQENSAKDNAAWSYSSVTVNNYGNHKEYGAAQIFEYTAMINKNYINSIVGNDTVAQNYGQSLYNELTSNGWNRLSNWDQLKQDPILGAIMTETINAQFAVAEALKNPSGGVPPLHKAQEAMQKAISAAWNFVSSNEQYKKDYENTINAYQAVYDYFTANPSQPTGDGSNIFKNNLNGTAANSYGAMAASILMSLGSTQNVLNAYLSGK